MQDCIFCKIVAGEIPCFKVSEDENFLAFLDINPNTKGVTLVTTKKHYPSNYLELPENVLTDTILFANKTAEKLRKHFGIKRVGLAIEGTGVDHLHIKLYPFHAKGGKKTEGILGEAKERIFYEGYPGFLTTQLGPQADFEELKNLAEEIKKA